MPKAYSEQERAYIKGRLQAEAAACMQRYGLKRTTVDELVKRVGIPKGTFYLFYQAKEELLFEVLLLQHEQLEQELYAAFTALQPEQMTVTYVTELLLSLFRRAEQLPILNLLNSEEVELLARRVPQEKLAAHLIQDETMLARLFPQLSGQNEETRLVLTAAFRALYFTTLHKKKIGAAQYEDALRLLVQGVVLQLFQG